MGEPMIKNYRWLSVLALVCFTSSGYANNEDLRQYFQQIIDEQQSALQSDLIMSSANDGFVENVRGWVDGTELRLSAENDDDNKRSIALRVKLKNAPRHSIEQDILQLTQEQRQLDHQQALNDRLQRAYSELLDLIAEQEQLDHLQVVSSMHAAAIKYYRNLVLSNDFHPENLLENELEHEQHRFQIELQVRQINALTKALKFDAKLPQLTLTEKMMLDVVAQYSDRTPLEVEHAQLDLMLQQKKLKHEQSGEKFALTAVQLSQEFNHNKDTVTGIQVDLRIPFARPAFNSGVRQQDVSEVTYRLHRLQQSAALKAAQLVQKMEQSQISILAFERLAKSIDSRIKKATDSRLIIKLRQQHLAQLKSIMRERQSFRKLYIELLAHYSVLGRELDTNWLIPPVTQNSRG